MGQRNHVYMSKIFVMYHCCQYQIGDVFYFHITVAARATSCRGLFVQIGTCSCVRTK